MINIITISEEYRHKNKMLDWAGYQFQISTGDWTKPNQQTITNHDFWFRSVDWIENQIKESKK